MFSLHYQYIVKETDVRNIVTYFRLGNGISKKSHLFTNLDVVLKYNEVPRAFKLRGVWQSVWRTHS